jgi:type IV fimbrial biogenesis protein FimT
MVSATPARARSAGFTLPELMAVIAIMVTIATFAAPSMGSLLAGQRAKAAASELFAALVRARSEAVKRNTEVTLSPAAAGKWESGWTIPNPTDSGHPIENHGALNGALISGPSAVVYLANGRIKGDTQPSFGIAFTGSDTHRCIQVDLSGRPALKSSGC